MIFDFCGQRDINAKILNLGVEGSYRFELGTRAELHDQVGQALTAIKVNLGMVEQKIAAVSPELRERIRESKLLAEQAMQEIRDSKMSANYITRMFADMVEDS